MQKDSRVKPLLTEIPHYYYQKSSVSEEGSPNKACSTLGHKAQFSLKYILLKTHSKDYSHRKFCKQDNFISLISKIKVSPKKPAKEIQSKTYEMNTVNSNFTALTKKK